jgi:uncharacterized membrane protein
MADVGISDYFIRPVRSKVTESTSALFLRTSDAVKNKVAKAMKGLNFEIIASDLSRKKKSFGMPLQKNNMDLIRPANGQRKQMCQ